MKIPICSSRTRSWSGHFFFRQLKEVNTTVFPVLWVNEVSAGAGKATVPTNCFDNCFLPSELQANAACLVFACRV